MLPSLARNTYLGGSCVGHWMSGGDGSSNPPKTRGERRGRRVNAQRALWERVERGEHVPKAWNIGDSQSNRELEAAVDSLYSGASFSSSTVAVPAPPPKPFNVFGTSVGSKSSGSGSVAPKGSAVLKTPPKGPPAKLVKADLKVPRKLRHRQSLLVLKLVKGILLCQSLLHLFQLHQRVLRRNLLPQSRLVCHHLVRVLQNHR